MTYYADLLLAHISGWIVCGVVTALVMAWLDEQENRQDD